MIGKTETLHPCLMHV